MSLMEIEIISRKRIEEKDFKHITQYLENLPLRCL
jgi:hypothetical protein